MVLHLGSSGQSAEQVPLKNRARETIMAQKTMSAKQAEERTVADEKANASAPVAAPPAAEPATTAPAAAPTPQTAPPPVPVVDGMTRDQFLAHHGNVKSRAIRALRAKGFEVSPIAKFLDIKYQHVRNVLMQKVGEKLEPAPKQNADA